MHQNLTFVLLKQEDKSLKNIYIKNIIESYNRCTIHDIAKALGILVSQVRPEAQTMSARLISLILTDDQKQVRVKQHAKQLLKLLPKFNQRKFSNIVTGDKTWVHHFKPVGQIKNKIVKFMVIYTQ